PVADLKELAEDFLKLTNAALAPPAPAPAAVKAEPPPAPRPPAIYTLDDADVVPPVDIARELPPWQPPLSFASATFSVTVTVDIDEHGLVERAALVQPITPLYDSKLLAAAKKWRFQPATKGGVPVKFRKSIAIVLHPSGG